MVEITTTLLEAIGLLLGGSGIGYLLTLKYARQQARGEARQAENEATKAVQDVYQELVDDVKKDREEQKQYIAELKEDRNHLRQDRDELRVENQKLRKVTNELQDEIQDIKKVQARQGRKLEAITPFLCSRTECTDRIRTTINELTKRKKSTEEESKDV